MTRMKGPSSEITLSNDDDKNLELLFEAFGSKLSPDDMASAYCQADHDLQKASDILYNMLGSSSSNDTISTDDLTSPPPSSIGSTDTYVGKPYEPQILSHPKPTNGARSGINEPQKLLYRPKHRNSGVSMGSVSGMIGADYGRSRASNKEAVEITKPIKLMSSEVSPSQLWDENPQTETMNKDLELFLLKMLGSGFQLDMNVIKEVVGGCGYDVRESMEKLMNMSTPTLDLGSDTSSMVDQTESMEAYEDLKHLDINCEDKDKLQFNDSAGRSNLEKEILSKLFNSQVRPESILTPRREVRSRKYGLVTGPLEDPVTKLKSPIVKEETNGDGKEDTEDNYESLRQAAMDDWLTMKKYYRAAAEAYARGSYELANKFIKQGHFLMDKAREANEMSGKMLTEKRNDGEAISMDLNNYDPKDAIRLLKTQLKSVSGIPSIGYLKVMVGPSNDKTKPNARKRMISKLLERENITWTEEEDGQIMAIRIDVVNPKRLTFNKNYAH